MQKTDSWLLSSIHLDSMESIEDIALSELQQWLNFRQIIERTTKTFSNEN